MVSVQADNCEMCSSWPSELTAGRALPSVELWVRSSCAFTIHLQVGTPKDMLSKWNATFGTTYMCAVPTKENPMAVNGSWIYINQPSDCGKSRNEAYPCPNNYGPYNDGLLMTMPSKGPHRDILVWLGLPDSFVWKGQKGWVNGRSIFSAVSPTYVAGAYCIYDNDNNKIMFCAPEEYAMNVGPSDPSTCQSLWTFPPTSSPTPPPTNASSSKKDPQMDCSLALLSPHSS